MSSLAKGWAFLRRDALIDIRYKVSFAIGALDVVAAIAAFYFLSTFLDDKGFNGHAAFPFIVTGMALNGCMTSCLVCFSQAVKGDQGTGTMKAALATPTSARAIILWSSLYPCVRALVEAGFYLGGGLILGLSLRGANVAAAVVVLGASLLAFSGLGIISAAFTLVVKRGDPLLWAVGSLSWLLSGVFYPVDILPTQLQYLAQLVPLTHAVDAFRATILTGASLSEVADTLARLLVFGLFAVPLGLALFEVSVQRARMDGTLGQA